MNRNVSLDLLKIFLAFMIVGIHAGFLHGVSPLWEYLSVNGLFRIAVPIFLLINGFYFYPVLLQGKSAFWFKRVLYLYLFWMLFYSYFWFRPSEISLIEIANLSDKLIFGFYHLWYFPGMLGAAVLVFLLKKKPPVIMILAILTTFIVGVIIQYARNYHLFVNPLMDLLFNSQRVHRSFLLFSFPFFCIGFIINKLGIHKKISLLYSAGLSLIGLALLICESYYNYLEPSRHGRFDNYASLLVVCPAVFLLFMNLDFRGKSKQLALYSTGVYVVHIFFLLLYRRFIDINGTALTFVIFISSILASYGLIMVNKKLKFIL